MDWTPGLKMSDLKPLIAGRVETLLEHLKGEGLKAAIVKVFKIDGCKNEICNRLRRLVYLEHTVVELQQRMDLVMTSIEEEEMQEIGLAGDVNELIVGTVIDGALNFDDIIDRNDDNYDDTDYANDE